MIDGPQTHVDALEVAMFGAGPGDVWGAWPPQSKVDTIAPGRARMSVVRTIVVDDQGLARRGLCRELRFEPDLEIVGEANTAESGVALAQDQRPDIIVMDVEMPVMDGVQAAQQVHALAPDCVIMLLTTRDSIETHERGRAAGARVILEKGSPATFRASMHDLVQFVKVRNTPAWPDIAAVDLPESGQEVIDEESDISNPISSG